MLNQKDTRTDDLFAPVSFGGGGGGGGGGGASNTASTSTAAMDGHFAANAAPAPGSANQNAAVDTGWSACVIDRVNNQGDDTPYAGVVCAVEGMFGR
jgi:hypothetical protein